MLSLVFTSRDLSGEIKYNPLALLQAQGLGDHAGTLR